MCILSVYTLLEVVGYYDFNVLSMSVMGFQKKKSLDGGVGWWGELYPSLFWIFGIFLTLQSPLSSPDDPRGGTKSIIIIIIILFIYFMLFLQMQGAHSLLQAHCYKLCTETLLQKH